MMLARFPSRSEDNKITTMYPPRGIPRKPGEPRANKVVAQANALIRKTALVL
jgi:hypothetical protein